MGKSHKRILLYCLLFGDSRIRSFTVPVNRQPGAGNKRHCKVHLFGAGNKRHCELLAGESPEGVSHPSLADRRKAGSIADAAHPKRIANGGRPSIASGEFQVMLRFHF